MSGMCLKFFLPVLFLSIVCVGCTRKTSPPVEQTLTKLEAGEPVTIVALGDSVTYGYGVQDGYVTKWKRLLKQEFPQATINMINAGVSGDTSVMGLERREEDVISRNPDLVTVCFGLNDMKIQMSLEEFRTNMVEIVHHLKQETSAEIWLLTTNPTYQSPGNYLVSKYNQVTREVAKAEKIGLIDIWKAWKKHYDGNAPGSDLLLDIAHPTEKGHEIFATELMKPFKRS